MNEQNPGDRLREWIVSRIRDDGPVPFSQFMEWCLYHPLYGYYRGDRGRIGKEGDYYTSSCVHPLFGGMVAKQLCQMSDILGGPVFTVLEMGAGRGFLCEDILAWAMKNAPEFYDRLQYGILEESPAHLREQKERISAAYEGKVFWIPPDSLGTGGLSVEGCILSNELIDAFPVHRVVYRGGAFQEMYVAEEDGCFVEQSGALSDPWISAAISDGGIDLDEGQQAEVNLAALRWLDAMGRLLTRGFIMTIDYGYGSGERHEFPRRSGTLRCYFRHRLMESPYERVGSQDMTSDVDFSALIRHGLRAGIGFTGLAPQYRFLIALGLLEEIEEAQKGLSDLDGLKLRLSLKHLLEPERGMGERFKVLVQHKGMEKPELTGLRDLRTMSRSMKGE